MAGAVPPDSEAARNWACESGGSGGWRCAAAGNALLARGTDLVAMLTSDNVRHLLVAENERDAARNTRHGGVCGAQLQRAVVGPADDPVLEQMIAQRAR